MELEYPVSEEQKSNNANDSVTYTVTETSAPAGFSLPSNPVVKTWTVNYSQAGKDKNNPFVSTQAVTGGINENGGGTHDDYYDTSARWNFQFSKFSDATDDNGNNHHNEKLTGAQFNYYVWSESKGGYSWAGDNAIMPHLAAQRMKIKSAIDRLRSGEAASGIRQQISTEKADMEQARAEYIRKSAGSNTALENQLAVLRQNLSDAQAAAAKQEASAASAETLVEGLDKDIATLRQQVMDEHAKEFDAGSGKCPTCGQPYPPEMLEQMRGNFNAAKAEKQAQMIVRGK